MRLSLVWEHVCSVNSHVVDADVDDCDRFTRVGKPAASTGLASYTFRLKGITQKLTI